MLIRRSAEEAFGKALKQFNSPNSLNKAKQHLNEIGITFDSGMGFDGRDWEWDYSLEGPISVRFKRRAANPERRK